MENYNRNSINILLSNLA
uniref:Uncharacterized protein n=1 Tax=Arundo donax TaxID=35708 RepID=A0A0A9DU06_ARUDO